MEQSEEKRSRPRRSNDLGPTGDVVSRNVARLRAARGLSTRQLAAVLADMGRVIPASGISKIETGTRRVDSDDLVALAVALRVTPMTLLLPPTIEGDVELTGYGTVPARAAWRWADGRSPLPAQGDAFTILLDFLQQARPEGLREEFEPDMFSPEGRKLMAAWARAQGMHVQEFPGGTGMAFGEHPPNRDEGGTDGE